MMTQHSQFSKANIYSEQPPTRKITLKVILYIVLALLNITLWIHNLFGPSLSVNWLWICSLFILGLIFGSSSLAFSNFKKWWPNAQNSQEQQETASGPGTSQQTYTILMWLYSIMMLTIIVALFVFVPTLTQNWQWICGLFILGSGGLILLDFNKRRSGAQKAREPRETVTIPGASQRGFSLLIWLCSILEVALVAVVFVMQFNGNANAKGLSESLISGALISLLAWLACRAYRYIDW
jgi:hypothetical protein